MQNVIYSNMYGDKCNIIGHWIKTELVNDASKIIFDILRRKYVEMNNKMKNDSIVEKTLKMSNTDFVSLGEMCRLWAHYHIYVSCKIELLGYVDYQRICPNGRMTICGMAKLQNALNRRTCKFARNVLT